MSETIKLCAMLVRHVFAPDDEARDEEMRRPFVEQAMRAKREHDEMRRNLAEADTTRREWEVRAATSYAAGRAAGLREAAEVVQRYRIEVWERDIACDPKLDALDETQRRIARLLALAPPAANVTITATSFDGRKASPYACDALPAAEPRDEGES